MGNGRKRGKYRLIAAMLSLTLTITSTSCGTPQDASAFGEEETSISSEASLETMESSAEEEKTEGSVVDESTTEEVIASSEESSAQESSEPDDFDPSIPREYVWDFDELVNAEWKEQAKKDGRYSLTNDYTRLMEERLQDILDNTDLDSLSKEDPLYKILYIYREQSNPSKRSKNVNKTIKEKLDRIAAVSSLEELYELYSEEEFANYNTISGSTVSDNGNGYRAAYVLPRYAYGECLSDSRSGYILLGLTKVGMTTKSASKIVENAQKMEEKIQEFYEKTGDAELIYVSQKLLEKNEVPIPVVEILTKVKGIQSTGEFISTPLYYDFLKETYQEENLEMLKSHLMVSYFRRLGLWGSKDVSKCAFAALNMSLDYDREFPGYLRYFILSAAGDILAQEYDRRYVMADEIKQETNQLITEIKQVVKENLSKNMKWVFPYQGKDFVEKKLDAIRVYIGENGIYNDLSDVVVTDDPIDNIISLYVSYDNFQREDLNRSMEVREAYGANMFETNAYYIPSLNAMMISTAWLTMYSDRKSQGDLAYEEKLAYLGVVLAHEIGHAYDSNNIYYNFRGVSTSWLEEKEADQYNAWRDAIIEFFDGKEVEFGYKLDGELVQDETFADLIAMGCCLKLLEERKNSDYDLFFKSFAKQYASYETKETMKYRVEHTHLPDKERVNYVLGQFDRFYKTYDVDEESPYYVPAEKRLIGFW